MGKTSTIGIVPKHILLGLLTKRPLIIAVTGTPGCGKTFLAHKLSLLVHATYLDLNKIAIKAGMMTGYDVRRRASILDETKLYLALKPVLRPKTAYIVDSHLSHYLPSRKVSLCIVARCGLKTLANRLKNRDYPAGKVKENLEAEALAVCLVEAKEAGHVVIEFDLSRTPSKRSLHALAVEMKRKLAVA